jgi:hypothetical protein
MPYADKDKQRAYHREYQQRPERKKYKKDWTQKNQAKITAAQNARYKANPEKYREYFRNHRIKKTYNLTESQYAEWVVKQGGCCGICGKEPSGEWHGDRMLNVDHNHETGAVRGLLCNQCNRALGLFGDSAARLQEAINYLERSNT